jgi:hypothetical protein
MKFWEEQTMLSADDWGPGGLRNLQPQGWGQVLQYSSFGSGKGNFAAA